MMSIRFFIPVLLAAFPNMVLATSPEQSAHKRQIINCTVAEIGKEAILASEVVQVLGDAQGNATTFDDALNVITFDKLIANEIKKLGLDVSEEEIDQAVKSVMSQHTLDKENLLKALRSQGLSLEEYRDQLKTQLYKMKLIQAKIKSRVKITKDDIKDAYRDAYGSQENEFKIHLRYLSFSPKTASSKRNAEKAIDRMKTGAGFLTTAQKLSGSEGVILDDFGEVRKGDLVAEIDNVAFTLPEGTFSGAIETPSAYYVIFAEKRIPVEKIPLEKVEKDLHKQLYEKEIERAFRQYVDELRTSTHIEVHNAARNLDKHGQGKIFRPISEYCRSILVDLPIGLL